MILSSQHRCVYPVSLTRGNKTVYQRSTKERETKNQNKTTKPIEPNDQVEKRTKLSGLGRREDRCSAKSEPPTPTLVRQYEPEPAKMELEVYGGMRKRDK